MNPILLLMNSWMPYIYMSGLKPSDSKYAEKTPSTNVTFWLFYSFGAHTRTIQAR